MMVEGLSSITNRTVTVPIPSSWGNTQARVAPPAAMPGVSSAHLT